MRITFLCNDIEHPVNGYLQKWIEMQAQSHEISLVRGRESLLGGDLLFLISCSEIISASDRAKYEASLVLHASDLPAGRGWSPHIWELVNGADQITLTMLEAEDKVDSGRIWYKSYIAIPKHALWNEINHLLFTEEIKLINLAVKNFGKLTPSEQDGDLVSTYYPKRSPKDSQIDPNKSILEQFDLIRICDPNRFPAFFEYLGHRYVIKVEKNNE